MWIATSSNGVAGKYGELCKWMRITALSTRWRYRKQWQFIKNTEWFCNLAAFARCSGSANSEQKPSESERWRKGVKAQWNYSTELSLQYRHIWATASLFVRPFFMCLPPRILKVAAQQVEHTCDRRMCMHADGQIIFCEPKKKCICTIEFEANDNGSTNQANGATERDTWNESHWNMCTFGAVSNSRIHMKCKTISPFFFRRFHFITSFVRCRCCSQWLFRVLC